MEEKGYQLFHIKDIDQNNSIKKEIWKSVLLNKCGISHKIHARKLQVVNLENYKEFTKIFLKENHLQGNCVSSIKLGLQDPKTGIVYSIMTFGKSRFNKNIEYEKLHPPVIYDKSKFNTKNKRKTTKHKQTTIEGFDKPKKRSVAERKLAAKVSKLNKLNINIKPVN